MPADFFISYTKADKDAATWIAYALEDAKFTTIIQEWDFTPGTNFVNKMFTEGVAANRTIAVLSPAYFESSFAASEWQSAFHKDPRGFNGKLLPVRINDFTPPDPFSLLD